MSAPRQGGARHAQGGGVDRLAVQAIARPSRSASVFAFQVCRAQGAPPGPARRPRWQPGPGRGECAICVVAERPRRQAGAAEAVLIPKIGIRPSMARTPAARAATRYAAAVSPVVTGIVSVPAIEHTDRRQWHGADAAKSPGRRTDASTRGLAAAITSQRTSPAALWICVSRHDGCFASLVASRDIDRHNRLTSSGRPTFGTTIRSTRPCAPSITSTRSWTNQGVSSAFIRKVRGRPSQSPSPQRLGHG